MKQSDVSARCVVTHAALLNELRYEKDSGNFCWITKRKGRNPSKAAGSITPTGYRTICINGVDILAHRLAWLYVHGSWPVGVIDHINGNRQDNRISNLRDVTQVENMLNVHKPRIDNTTGYRGVSLHKPSGKYLARLKIGGKYKSLGLFACAEAAAAAYTSAKLAAVQ